MLCKEMKWMISFALKCSPHSPKNMSPPFIWLYIYFYNRDLACTNPLIRFLILCALKNICYTLYLQGIVLGSHLWGAYRFGGNLEEVYIMIWDIYTHDILSIYECYVIYVWYIYIWISKLKCVKIFKRLHITISQGWREVQLVEIHSQVKSVRMETGKFWSRE